MRAVRIVAAAIVVAAALAISLAPQLRLALVDPISQLVALRPLLAIAFAAAAIGAAVVAVVQRRRARAAALARRRGRKPAKPPPTPLPLAAIVLAVGLAAAAAINVTVVALRGLDPAVRVSVAELAALPEAEGEVTVVVINALWGNVTAETIARLALASYADAVFLPEGSAELAREAAALLAGAGAGEWHAVGQASGSDAAVLVSAAFGPYHPGGGAAGSTAEIPGGAAIALPDGAGPPLAAVHPFPPPQPWPLSSGGRTIQDWATEVRASMELCRQLGGGILAGDLNATLDHPVLSARCGFVDAAAATGAGGWGTWPRGMPALLGTPIDHVFVDPARWTPRATWIVDVEGSDHRAVVARLAEVPPLGG